jgi:hypothetical protein
VQDREVRAEFLELCRDLPLADRPLEPRTGFGPQRVVPPEPLPGSPRYALGLDDQALLLVRPVLVLVSQRGGCLHGFARLTVLVHDPRYSRTRTVMQR